MLKIERQTKIIKYLNINGSLRITDIANEFNCSEETIRKDLAELEAKTNLVKTHGGAYLKSFYDKGFSYEIRETLLKKEKEYIAKIAVEYIKNNDTIFLDSSTTCIELAKKIVETKFFVTIITNSLQIANLFNNNSNNKLILVGGEFKSKNKTFIGYNTTNTISSYIVDIALISYPSIDMEYGLGDNTIEELMIRNLMLKQARQKILLLDHTKFHEKDSVVFSKIENINIIITDNKPSKEWLGYLEKEGIYVKF